MHSLVFYLNSQTICCGAMWGVYSLLLTNVSRQICAKICWQYLHREKIELALPGRDWMWGIINNKSWDKTEMLSSVEQCRELWSWCCNLHEWKPWRLIWAAPSLSFCCLASESKWTSLKSSSPVLRLRLPLPKNFFLLASLTLGSIFW